MKLKTSTFIVFFMCFYGLLGQSSLFLGNTVSYVNLGDLDVTGDQITVEALIHYTGPSVNIVSKHTGPPDVNYLLRPGNFEITTTNGYANVASGVALEVGVTYHLAATYNGNTLAYYINGCLTNEIPLSGNMITNDLDAAIGQNATTETEQFIGYIDEVRIWNIARSENDIASNMMDLPNPTLEPGLLVYYKFDNNLINVQGNPTFDGTAIGPIQYESIPYPYPSPKGINATASPVVCAQTNTGAINIAGNGGYKPYEFSIDGVNFVSTPDFEDLLPGNYTVYSRSNENCVASTTVVIDDQPELLSNLEIDQVDCFGNENGSASIFPEGGNGADFQWEWSTGNTTELDVDELIPGNYDVTILDSCKISGHELVENGHFENGDEGFTSEYTSCNDCFAGINDIPAENYVVTADANLHHGIFQGVGNGGSGNFMVVNGSETPNTAIWCQTISVEPNTYYFLSFAVSSMFPSDPAELQFEANGDLIDPVITAPGTVLNWLNYSTTWFSGSATSVDLCIKNNNIQDFGNDFGLDDISMKKCVSCELNEDFIISEPPLLEASETSDNPQCLEDDGEISIEAQGGVTPYVFSIDGGDNFQTSGEFSGLAPGEYDIVVRDANDCEVELTVNLVNEGGPTVSAGADQEICVGESVTLSASGADSYSWSDGVEDGVPFEPTSTITYTVTGTDAFNCTDADQVTVIVNPLPNIDAGEDILLCEGDEITLEGQGGDSYTWDNGVQDGIPFTPASSGTYTVIGIDENGCENSDQVEVVLYQLSGTTSSEAETCAGGNGSANINVSGGVEPYVYNWQPTNTSGSNLENVNAGTYTVTVQDINGCELVETVIVDAPNVLSIQVNQQVNPTCSGEANGEISVSVSGGEGPYQYDWTPNVGSSPSLSGLTEGTYTVVITDADQCTSTETIVLNAPDQITISPLVVASDCGQDNGQITWNVSGGTPNYAYNWSPSITSSASASDLQPGLYQVEVVDANGCSASSSVTLPQIGGLNVDVDPPFSVIEEGDEVELNVTTNSTSGSVFYSWFPEEGLSCTDCPNPIASPDVTTTYIVEVVDGNNCEGVSETEVNLAFPCNGVHLPNMFSPNGDGNNDLFCVLANCINSMELRIYNRFGELMYSSFSVDDCWDGTHKNQPVNTGAYVYKLIYVEEGIEKVKSGNINLIR